MNKEIVLQEETVPATAFHKPNWDKLWMWATSVNTFGFEKTRELCVCIEADDVSPDGQFGKILQSYKDTGSSVFENDEVRNEYEEFLYKTYEKYLALVRKDRSMTSEQEKQSPE